MIAAVAFASRLNSPHFARNRVIVPELLGRTRARQQASSLSGCEPRHAALGPPLAGVLTLHAARRCGLDAATYAVSFFLLAVSSGTKLCPRRRGDLGFRALLAWAGGIPFPCLAPQPDRRDMAWQAIFISLPCGRHPLLRLPRIVGAIFLPPSAWARVLGNTVATGGEAPGRLTLIARVPLFPAAAWLLVFEVPSWAAIGVLGASGLHGLTTLSCTRSSLRIPSELRRPLSRAP